MLGKFDTSILDCIPEVTFIRDRDMTIQYVNSAAKLAVDINRQEVIGKKCWQIFGSIEGGCRHTCKVDQMGKSECSLFQPVNKAGEKNMLYPTQVSATPLVADGQTLGTLITLQNSDDRITSDQTNDSLDSRDEHSQEKYRLHREGKVFEDGPVVICHWNTSPGWPVKYVSHNIAKFGYQPESFLSGEIQFASLIHPEDREEVIRKIEQSLAQGADSFAQEYRIIGNDDKVHWVYCSSQIIRYPNDDITYFCGYLIDITAYRKERVESSRNRDTLDKLLDALPQAVFWKDKEGRFLGCNRVFASFFGFRDPEVLIGKTDQALPIPQHQKEAYQADDREVIASRRPKYNIVEPIHLENETQQRWGNTSKAPLFDEHGEPYAVLGIIDDITERKAMEEALEKRIIALTMPLNDPEQIEFFDLFSLDDLQELQDDFCKATGVAGMIVRPDGTALSQPSNFCRLCSEKIRANTIAKARCKASDAAVGRLAQEGPVVQQCLCAGLWEGGAAIKVGGRHVATFLIGQVRDENQTEEQIRALAKEIGADEQELLESFLDVPVMSREQFSHVSEALNTLTSYLSTLAYQNVQQARYITQRKQTENALIKSQEAMVESRLKLQLALSMTKMSHWEGSLANIRGMEDSVFTFNDQFYELHGTTAEREGGYRMAAKRYTDEFVHPDDAWMLSREINTKIAEMKAKEFRQLEHRIIRRDGEVRHIAVSYQLQCNERGEPRKTLGVTQDITEHKLAEEQLLKAKQEAEEANRIKSVFLANMSHEIRTPINGLMGTLQLMQGSNTQPEHEEYIKLAIQSSQKLTRLLSDILDLSKVEAGKMYLSPEPFELRDTLGNVFQLFEPAALEKGIRLEMKIDPNLPETLVGDGLRLQQILVNLIGNAVKFTLSGGVKIDVHILPVHRNNQCRILFCVTDTGIGVSDKTLAKLFTPFSQERDRYRHQFGGAGLGLAITRQLIELMGGTITMVSEEARGTSFYVSLPFKHTKTSCKTENHKQVPNTIGNRSILLAEDDSISRMIAEQLLVRTGFSVRTAENGLQALELLREDNFDLIIMDVQMPVIDGLQATEIIREGGAGEDKQTIPIIALTARAMNEDKRLITNSGMDGYVEKPMELKRLLEEINRVCSMSMTSAGSGTAS